MPPCMSNDEENSYAENLDTIHPQAGVIRYSVFEMIRNYGLYRVGMACVPSKCLCHSLHSLQPCLQEFTWAEQCEFFHEMPKTEKGRKDSCLLQAKELWKERNKEHLVTSGIWEDIVMSRHSSFHQRIVAGYGVVWVYHRVPEEEDDDYVLGNVNTNENRKGRKREPLPRAYR